MQGFDYANLKHMTSSNSGSRVPRNSSGGAKTRETLNLNNKSGLVNTSSNNSLGNTNFDFNSKRLTAQQLYSGTQSKIRDIFDSKYNLKTEPDCLLDLTSQLKTPSMGRKYLELDLMTQKRNRSSSNEKFQTLKKFYDSSKRVLTTESSEKDLQDEIRFSEFFQTHQKKSSLGAAAHYNSKINPPKTHTNHPENPGSTRNDKNYIKNIDYYYITRELKKDLSKEYG